MDGAARAVADLTEGQILASVEIAAPPERVFRALASQDIVNWWVRPGVFDTRQWAGDVRVGGHWEASGMGGGRPYTLRELFWRSTRPGSWCTRGTRPGRRLRPQRWRTWWRPATPAPASRFGTP